MARSRKIKKKKSFMFTTKHHSFAGVLGVVLFALCISIQITSIMYAFHNRGEVDISFGYYGFLASILDVIGIFAGISGLNERDAFKVAPLISIIGNGVVLAAWIALVILAKV